MAPTVWAGLTRTGRSWMACVNISWGQGQTVSSSRRLAPAWPVFHVFHIYRCSCRHRCSHGYPSFVFENNSAGLNPVCLYSFTWWWKVLCSRGGKPQHTSAFRAPVALCLLTSSWPRKPRVQAQMQGVENRLQLLMGAAGKLQYDGSQSEMGSFCGHFVLPQRVVFFRGPFHNPGPVS